MKNLKKHINETSRNAHNATFVFNSLILVRKTTLPSRQYTPRVSQYYAIVVGTPLKGILALAT